ncbi:hypothetical protein AB0J90_00800 [Micromonospora sp. NPDC049523]|uniref:effector-associated constant component EACC1 n=1 Tax=Micromonospora sp. NPDC049523 TaxID=3155921 RepID=UPI00343BDE32
MEREYGVQVRIVMDDPAASAELFDWLRADAGLVRSAEVRPGPADPGKLGALEIIDVLLGQATAISGLALAVDAWRRSRSRPETITISREDGATLTLPSGDAGNVDVIRQFLAEEDGGSGQTGQ